MNHKYIHVGEVNLNQSYCGAILTLIRIKTTHFFHQKKRSYSLDNNKIIIHDIAALKMRKPINQKLVPIVNHLCS